MEPTRATRERIALREHSPENPAAPLWFKRLPFTLRAIGEIIEPLWMVDGVRVEDSKRTDADAAT